MIDERERAKMSAVRLDLMHEINLQAARPIWRAPTAIIALQNLIDAADRETAAPAQHAGAG